MIIKSNAIISTWRAKQGTMTLFVLAIQCISISAANKIPYAEKIMVFSPHPDDDILGCGGILIKHVRDGSQITVVYVTSGDASPEWSGTREELIHTREEEAKKATEKLGITDLIFLKEPDGKLAENEININAVAELLLTYRPELIYIPNNSEAHKDHKATFRLVKEAIKQAAAEDSEWKIPLTLCYEVWTPMETITHQVNISRTIELKLEALAEHKSQAAYYNYADLIRSLNRYRGLSLVIGEYAECFRKLEID